MTVVGSQLSEVQHDIQLQLIAAVARDEFDALRAALYPAARDEWIPPATLTVAAALITVIVDGRNGLWELDESLWEQFLPERLPAGRSEWRNANYALQAAGCLAGGVWLDVARQESFWHIPLWIFTFDLVELLTEVAKKELSLSGPALAEAIQTTPSPRPSR